MQKLNLSVEEAHKGMLAMVTKVHDQRGVPEAIQQQFEEQQRKATGQDHDVYAPLMPVLQWKAL